MSAIDTSTELEQALHRRVEDWLEGRWPEGEDDSWVCAYLQGWPAAEIIRMGTFSGVILCESCHAPFACTQPDASGTVLLKTRHDGTCPVCRHELTLVWPE